jgi:hypothetical protein
MVPYNVVWGHARDGSGTVVTSSWRIGALADLFSMTLALSCVQAVAMERRQPSRDAP